MERKAAESIRDWLKGKKRKCLVVLGARQVGKTHIIEEIGNSDFEELMEINFKKTPSDASFFSGDLSVEAMVMAMRFKYPEKKITPGKTLIFLDEIQECPEAITSLKFWAIDNRYDVIASGSLLGIDYKRSSSYPVGYVDYLKMYALDYEEFLWANGISKEMTASIGQYSDGTKKIPEAINGELMRRYREYIAIGGMPEAVQKYVDTRDYREVDAVQKAILQGYLYDIAHYASAEEKAKAEKCYLSLGKQLLDKENRKFQYKEVEKGGRAQKYYSSIEWLLSADIIHKSRLVSDFAYDLEDYAKDDFYRAYTTDLSLLLAMRDFSLKRMIYENSLSGSTKGGIYECAVADALYKKGYSLYFYKDESTRREIDIIIEIDGKVVPIEVKSSNNPAKSLRSAVKSGKDVSYAYKFIDGNCGVSEDKIITLPLYMAAFI